VCEKLSYRGMGILPMYGKGMSAFGTVFSLRLRLPVRHTGRMPVPLLTHALRPGVAAESTHWPDEAEKLPTVTFLIDD